MIDAYQATVIAAIGDGVIVHYTKKCIGDEPWSIASEEWKADGEKPGEFEIHLEAEGYSALSRYSIHELEQSYASDLDEDQELAYSYVTCDQCGERIE